MQVKMKRLDKILLYLNTIKYLKPIQILYRGKPKWFFGRINQNGMGMAERYSDFLFIEELDADSQYMGRFDCDELLNNRVTFLNETHVIDLRNWTLESGANHLWLFNLQYMEFLIPLAVRFRETKCEIYYQKLNEYLTKWMACFDKPKGDAWNAYVISERIVNWLIVMSLLGDKLKADIQLRQRMERSLWLQYKYLQNHQEKHLLGNHYFENLKALVISAIMFEDRKRLARYLKQLKGQIKEQILSDGMHFERSFMYHRIIMEDLLRVIVALKAMTDQKKIISYCEDVLARMLSCTLSMEGGLRRVPLFNDAGDNVAKSTIALEKAVRRNINKTKQCQITDSFFSLPKAGYYKYQYKDFLCIVDCGELGPSYIPGHGQCDCLSYEIYVGGEPFIVNSGTYHYQSDMRTFFRSTQAHNCFIVNGCQQSQCWGEHRVAKRISKVWANRKEKEFEGGCTFWNGIRVRRKIEMQENEMVVYDFCENKKAATIQTYVHLAPNVEISLKNDSCYELIRKNDEKSMFLKILQADKTQVHTNDMLCNYAEEFGILQHKNVFEITGVTGLPIIYKFEWRRS